MAASDLVGEPDAFDACVDAFLEECAGLGWRPAVVGARGDRLDVYRRRGLHAVYIGDEAVIDVARFALGGKRMRNARHSVNRSHNFSVTTEIWRDPPGWPTDDTQLTLATCEAIASTGRADPAAIAASNTIR